MGLGSIELISLADAREQIQAARKLLLAGKDPIEMREEAKQTQALEKLRTITFQECAEAYIAAHCQSWKSAKHRSQWRNTIKTYAMPILGHLLVQNVDTDLVLRVLEPIWHSRTETAVRLMGRIGAILDWAAARKYRHGENPAKWVGHLDKLLPNPSKISPHRHHAAMPVAEIAVFMEDLRQHRTVGAYALEFCILTASRTGEALGARWEEFNFSENIWSVPAYRIKSGKEHRVPLSNRALEILDHMKKEAECDLVFPGRTGKKQLSDMTLLKIIRSKGLRVVTHGFRSTFKDWASENTHFSNEVSEMALAHKVGSKVEAAYRRGDLFLKRRKLMESWANFCCADTETAEVIMIGANAV